MFLDQEFNIPAHLAVVVLLVVGATVFKKCLMFCHFKSDRDENFQDCSSSSKSTSNDGVGFLI